MREKILELRNSRNFVLGNAVIFLLLAVVCLVSYIGGTGISFMAMASIMVLCFMFMSIEVSIHRGGFQCFEHGTSSIVFHILKVVFACGVLIFTTTAYERLIAIVMIVLFSIDAMLYVPFDMTVNRVITYLILAVIYVVSFSIYYVRESHSYAAAHSSHVLPASMTLQIIVGGAVVLISVIGVSEILAILWSVFEKKIFAQDRAVENLNELNSSLREHQEQIKKINEVLGRQKIDLQAANKKINRAHDEMSLQNEVASTITASLGKEEMLQNVTKIMRIRLDVDLVMVILEPDNSLLAPGEEPRGRYLAISESIGEEFEEAVEKSVAETDLKELMMLTKPYIQNLSTNTIKFFKYLDSRMELPSLICLPIFKQSERLGTLVVGRNKENAFMDGRSFFENIASQLSIGISNARLYAKMNDMAIRDGLTRIFNRGHLQMLLNEYLSEAMKKKIPVTLALFDIDKFKLVNDNYGHQCGDEVIKYVARLLNKGALHYGGIAGRYGGEEFVIAFLGKNLKDTNKIIEEIHDEIRTEVVEYAGQTIHVTASAGIASYPETCTNPSELLTRADWAMYTSKRNGRNQITVDSDQIITMMT